MFRFWPLSAPDRNTIEALRHIKGRLDRLETAPTPTTDLDLINSTLKNLHTTIAAIEGRVDGMSDELDAVQSQAKDFTIALSEGIERTDRAERRIKATVQRARKELKARGYDDPGLDAEAYELQQVDGDRGEDQGVLPLRASVEEAPNPASSIKGVSVEHLRRVRGF